MPPEHTKPKSKLDGTHTGDLEMRRNRGKVGSIVYSSPVFHTNRLHIAPRLAVPNAEGEFEMRIKCDKQVPCQSCRRRGCTALCPNGSLRTGQRFVLATTEHFNSRISELSSRIRQLEDALSTLQAKQSTKPHPLLAPELVSSEEKPSTDDNSKVHDETIEKGGSGQASSSGSNTGEVIDTFGTLSIPGWGVSMFGSIGESKSLVLSNQESHTSTSSRLGPPPSLHPLKDVPLTLALVPRPSSSGAILDAGGPMTSNLNALDPVYHSLKTRYC